MQAVRIIDTYFETNSGGTAEPAFVGGQVYPLGPDSQRQVDLGNAEIIDVLDDPAKAEGVAESAEAAAAKAAEKAAAARAAADAAAQVAAGAAVAG